MSALLNKQRSHRPVSAHFLCLSVSLLSPCMRLTAQNAKFLWRVYTQKYNTFGEYCEPSVYGS
nr:MAG TPA: hypothetical protein [Caudoviricetes sp.]